jgi:hypothetical protein
MQNKDFLSHQTSTKSIRIDLKPKGFRLRTDPRKQNQTFAVELKLLRICYVLYSVFRDEKQKMILMLEI